MRLPVTDVRSARGERLNGALGRSAVRNINLQSAGVNAPEAQGRKATRPKGSKAVRPTGRKATRLSYFRFGPPRHGLVWTRIDRRNNVVNHPRYTTLLTWGGNPVFFYP